MAGGEETETSGPCFLKNTHTNSSVILFWYFDKYTTVLNKYIPHLSTTELTWYSKIFQIYIQKIIQFYSVYGTCHNKYYLKAALQKRLAKCPTTTRKKKNPVRNQTQLGRPSSSGKAHIIFSLISRISLYSRK